MCLCAEVLEVLHLISSLLDGLLFPSFPTSSVLHEGSASRSSYVHRIRSFGVLPRSTPSP